MFLQPGLCWPQPTSESFCTTQRVRTAAEGHPPLYLTKKRCRSKEKLETKWDSCNVLEQGMMLIGNKVGQGEKLAPKYKYFKAWVGQYLNPLKSCPLYQRKINSLLFPGLNKEPGLSDRSKLGGPVLWGGRLYWWLMERSPGPCGALGETSEGDCMPGMSGASAEGVAGLANSRSTRWRSFSSSWRRIISSKALNCSCSRWRRCISATRSLSASSARCLDCSRAITSSSAFWACSKCNTSNKC